jgi:predicted O-linked N-acetylglucosamine transferase (SPINDLY family)
LRALVKLEQVMPARLRRRTDALRSAILPLQRAGPMVDADVLATLATSCRDQLRVGFACGYFSRHSVSKLFAGWIRHMSRAKFQVIGYDLAESEPDEFGRGLLADFDAVRRKVDGIDKWAATIRNDALDALIYPEIGMESQSVRLAALRLAPLQMVAMGHPMTTGIPTVDVFLTSDLMEPADGQTHYTERLLRLPNLSFDYERQPAGGPEFRREELGLDPRATVFICCQSLFKYRPDDDDVIVRIAREVPNAQFAFLGVPTAPLTEIFSTRLGGKFAAAGIPYAGRVVIVPPVAFERFGAFLRAGDIYLDSLGWSGGNTSLEAASVGLPIVTTPGGPMRARHTAAILHFMGLGQYVAPSQDAYVAFAAKLAGDPALRKAYAGEIARNADKLFGDLAPVRAIENFIVAEIAAREQQQPPSS